MLMSHYSLDSRFLSNERTLILDLGDSSSDDWRSVLNCANSVSALGSYWSEIVASCDEV